MDREMNSDLKALVAEFKSAPNGYVFGVKTALFVVLTAWGVQAVQAPGWFFPVIGTILLGCMFVHGVELQHQALHYTGFQSRRLNEVVGIALGMPMLVSFAAYQASHLRHHRFLGTDKNREFFDYGDQYGSGALSAAMHTLLRFSMAQHYFTFAKGVVNSILGRDFPGETVRASRRIRRDHLLMSGTIIVLCGVSYVQGQPLIISAWLIPLLLVAGPLHALVEMPEHYRCDTKSTDVFKNTRTIKSSAFLTWFANGNNLHVEHHLLPGLMIEKLPELHEYIAPRIQHLYPTYASFFFEALGWQPKQKLVDSANLSS